MDTGTLNFTWSRQLVAGLAAAGVADAILSPGSRSTPLALALLRQPGLRTRVIVDERAAAFFALGLAKASGRPVALVATSGSAPANWHPAVIEAAQGEVPLVLLAADRPPELQACGANQTIDQADLFGRHLRAHHALAPPEAGFDPGWAHRLAAQIAEEACWPRPGPVYVNQPFREPLLPAVEPPTAPPLTPLSIARGSLPPPPPAVEALATRLSGRPGAIICGELPASPGFATAVTALAARLDCPILAEPLSGLRFGPHDRSRLCCRYEGWLRNGAFVNAHRPSWLLRFGAFPVTRSLQGFAAEAAEVIQISPTPGWSDPPHRLTQLLRADPTATCQALARLPLQGAAEGWRPAFAAAEAAAADCLAATEGGAASLLPAILGALPAGCPVFVGNSMAIRDVDAFSGSGPAPLAFFGNRGASGIDGNVSTALGIAAARGQAVALLGDLTCQHDFGGLAAARDVNAVLVVFNNGGGGIFDYLPQAALPEFERGWLTPQHVDFAAAAAAFGLGYRRAETAAEVAETLRRALAAGGSTLVEIPIDRAASLAHRRAWLEAVERSAMG